MRRGRSTRFQAGCDLGDAPAKPGIPFERVLRDLPKRLRKRFRYRGKGSASWLRAGTALRQHLNQDDAQRPHVARGGKRLIRGFRGVVRCELGGGLAGFTGREEPVGREFDLIAGGQNV